MLICLDDSTGIECGAENRDNAKHCAKCGRPLSRVIRLQNPGALVGHYRIVGLLGRGGFGAVYDAVDVRQTVHVALKETLDAQGVSSLVKEFATLRNLHHPNLPSYYEVFELQSNGYLVMELVPGQNLQDILDHQNLPLPETQVLGYAVQICDVLTYLHTQNPPIIHRDIKPANIRITPDGLIKLVDFGLLKLGTGATQTAGGRALTPAYAPLEQYGAGSQHTDPRSDIYSLGATIYQLLTNRPPLPATDRVMSPLDPLPPLQNLNPQISAHVARAVTIALSIKSSDRFPDIATFRQALQGLAVPMPAPSGNPSIEFTAQSGRTLTISDLPSLVDACDTHWEDGKRHLFNRDIEVWLGILQQNYLIKKAAEVLDVYAKTDQDVGLEKLLEEAEKQGVVRPHRPRVQVSPNGRIDLGELHGDESRSIAIQNVGGGFFFAEVKSTANWLSVSSVELRGNKPQTIELKTDLSKLPLGQPQQTTLTLETSGGRIDLPIQVMRVNAQVYLDRGAALYNSRQPDRALQNYQEALNREPNSQERANAIAAIAVIYADLGRWDECFQWAAKERPARNWVDDQKLHWQNARANVIRFCKAWGDELYRQSARRDESLLSKARNWYVQGQRLGLTGADLIPLAQIYVDLAIVFCDQSKFDVAVQAWTQANGLAPSIASSRDLANRFIESARELASRGQFEPAVQRYRQAQEIAPFLAESAGLAQIYFDWAQDAYQKGDLEIAVEKGGEALAQEPNNAKIARAYADWQIVAGRVGEVAQVGAWVLAASGLSILAGFALAWLIHSLTALTITSVFVVGLSGFGIFVFGPAYIVRRSARRFLDFDHGGVKFILGLLIGDLLWSIPAILISLGVNIFIARQTLTNVQVQSYWFAAWIFGLAVVMAILGEEPSWNIRIGLGTLSAVPAVWLESLYGGIGGLLLGAWVGSLIAGTGAFVRSYLSGQSRPQARWEPLLTLGRIGAVVILTALAGILVFWEIQSDRTVQKIVLYQQAQSAMASKNIPQARQPLRDLLAIDPKFNEAANLLALAREIDLSPSAKSVDRDQAEAGDILTYSIVVTNKGPDAAPGVVVTDILPSQIRVVPESVPAGVTRTRPGPYDELGWSGLVSPNNSISISFQAQVLPVAGPTQVIANAVQLDNGIGGVITRQAIVRLVPTATPSPTGTPTITPRPTRTPLPTALPTETPQPPKLTVASASWGNTQGQGGWYYVEGKPGDYANWQDMRWDPNMQYQFCDGGCWRSNSEADFVRLDRFGGHPGQSHYVGKRWVSPIAGRIRVSILAHKAEAGGDGVTLRIVQNGNVIRPPISLDGDQTQDRAVRITFDTTMTVGGWIMMAVDSNGNTDYDHTVFDMTVWQLP